MVGRMLSGGSHRFTSAAKAGSSSELYAARLKGAPFQNSSFAEDVLIRLFNSALIQPSANSFTHTRFAPLLVGGTTVRAISFAPPTTQYVPGTTSPNEAKPRESVIADFSTFFSWNCSGGFCLGFSVIALCSRKTRPSCALSL